MTKRMLIEATHPEETRVVVVDGKKLEEFDYESSTKRQIKGNIYLARVTRVEPSLQAAFVEYGGNRHGFLAFSEIHPDYYRIPVEDRDAILAEHAAMQAAEGDEEYAGNSRRGGRSRSGSRSSPARQPIEDPSESAGAPAVPLAFHSESLAGPQFEGDGAPDDQTNEDNGTPAESASEQSHDHSSERHEHHEHDEHEHHEDHEHHEHEHEHDEHEHRDDRGQHEHHGQDALHDDSASTETNTESTPASPPELIETVGGDEAEEMRRRRSRPHRRYKIQEVIKRRQIMLVQVTKEERGNKGAALTSYLSLAGRYCVLMPNTGRGGGISRKITSAGDRKRLKSILDDLNIPDGMAVIVRTAGSERNKTELRRDYDYLLRLWDEIREHTLKSSAPALIYEEASLIKRAIRDLYAREIDEVLVEGEEAYKAAKNFMRMLMPSHAKRVQLYKDPTVHLLQRYQVEGQLDAIHNPIVHLKSGGYIVINPTEALVAIDVNSGRATRERNIEETATRTNLEAADEVGRQLRLRDLAGLIVIDFIDMEESRNNAAVERRLKEAMRNDRARIQVGRISAFGLLELSRQRLRPSLIEASTETCRHCRGTGHLRSTESTALHVLRAIEEEGAKARGVILNVAVPTSVALYVLNNKRAALAEVESKHALRVVLSGDDSLIPPDHRIERSRAPVPGIEFRQPVSQSEVEVDESEPEPEAEEPIESSAESSVESSVESGARPATEHSHEGRRRPRRRRRRRDEGRRGHEPSHPMPTDQPSVDMAEAGAPASTADDEGQAQTHQEGPSDRGGGAGDEGGQRRRRRRGRRGGRRRRRGEGREGEGSSAGSFNGGTRHDHRGGAEHGQSGQDTGPSDRPEPADAPTPESTSYRDEPAPFGGSSHERGHDKPAESHRPDEAASTVATRDNEPEQDVRSVPDVRESEETSSPRRGWWKRLVE